MSMNNVIASVIHKIHKGIFKKNYFYGDKVAQLVRCRTSNQ